MLIIDHRTFLTVMQNLLLKALFKKTNHVNTTTCISCILVFCIEMYLIDSTQLNFIKI